MSIATEKVNRISGLTESPNGKSVQVTVSAPKMRTVDIHITGTAPYLQCRFPEKAMNMMKAKQAAGDQTGKRAKRAPRNFEADYIGALHKTASGKCGIPASAFRSAAISACRLVGFKMTIAKLSVFIVADDYDAIDATPLVFIDGKPEKHECIGRNADGGADIRVRAIFKEWSAKVRVRFDEDQFSLADVMNLFNRVGCQIGIGEGRPDSKNSAGMGFGTFEIAQ